LAITFANPTYVHKEINILFKKRLMQYFNAHTYSSVLAKEINNERHQGRQYMCKEILKRLHETVERQ